MAELSFNLGPVLERGTKVEKMGNYDVSRCSRTYYNMPCHEKGHMCAGIKCLHKHGPAIFCFGSFHVANSLLLPGARSLAMKISFTVFSQGLH